MDPDYFTRTKRLSTFFRLYSKILLYGSAIVISIITMIIIAGWDTDATEDFKTNQLGQVLAVTDGEPETGGVTFGIPTQFTSDAQFDASITVAQDSRLDGDVYYRGDLVDLSLLSADGLQLDASSIANV